jgi:hypothetical protein
MIFDVSLVKLEKSVVLFVERVLRFIVGRVRWLITTSATSSTAAAV